MFLLSCLPVLVQRSLFPCHHLDPDMNGIWAVYHLCMAMYIEEVNGTIT